MVGIAEISGAPLHPRWDAESSGQPSDSGDTIESSIEAQDSLGTVDLHHGNVDRISRRQPFLTQHDVLGSFHCRLIDPKYFIDNSQQGIKCRLNCIRTLDRNITVKDFLQHFRVGHQALVVAHQFLQPTTGIGLMRMGGTDQVHGNV
jgi:hypothetical protein